MITRLFFFSTSNHVSVAEGFWPGTIIVCLILVFMSGIGMADEFERIVNLHVVL